MIAGFSCRETEKIAPRAFSTKFPVDIQKTASRKLAFLKAAVSLQSIGALPGNRLEALKGNRKGQYSIRVNDKYRICFRWEDGAAVGVHLIDYH